MLAAEDKDTTLSLAKEDVPVAEDIEPHMDDNVCCRM
jgi:hypothetical protein